jgi:branched-chain amino acid transport system ATP-binding protein
MLKLSDVVLSYGPLEVVHGISLEVEKGKLVALLGANGAGKSTTLNAIAGLMPVRSGDIAIEGRRIDRKPSHVIFQYGVALVPQGRELFPDMTIWENLELGIPSSHLRDRDRLMEEILDLFPRLRERLNQMAGTLSGGERAMLAIGRALVSRPKVLLLDEPTAGLAPLIVRQVMETLLKLKAAGQTVILVEQNVKMALKIADFAYVMGGGRILDGRKKENFETDSEVFHSFIS